MMKSDTVDLLWVAAPKGLAGVTTLVLHLLAMRQLDPAAYGVFGLALTFLIVLEGFAGSSLDMSVLREAPLWHTSGKFGFSPLERTALLMKGLLCAVICLAAFLVPSSLQTAFFRGADSTGVLQATAVGAAGILLLRSVQVNFQVSRCPRWFALSDLANTVLRLSFVWIVIQLGLRSPAALVASYAAASWIVLGVFAPLVLRASVPACWLDRAKFRQLASYGTGVLLVGGLSTLLTSLDMFALGLRGSPEQTGFYRAALTIALIPEFAGNCIAQAFAGRIARDASSPVLARYFTKVHATLLLACVGVWTLTAAFFPFAGRLLPEQYVNAIPVIRVLLPAGLAGLFAFPILVNYLAFYSLRTIFLLDCILAPLLVAAYYFGAPQGAITVAIITSCARVSKAAGLYAAASRQVRRDHTDASTGLTSGRIVAQEEAHA
jgi:O-antigen/teichoic acid export membrane protein